MDPKPALFSYHHHTSSTPYRDTCNYESYERDLEIVFTRFRIRGKRDTKEDVHQAREFLFAPARRMSLPPSSDPQTVQMGRRAAAAGCRSSSRRRASALRRTRP